jgi:hypothetical protein
LALAREESTLLRSTNLARVHTVVLLAAFALAPSPADPVRIERTSPADVPVGTTTLVSHDVSQWTCLMRMPSAVVVPVNVRMSDRAEATRVGAGEGFAYRIFCRVVLAVNPGSERGSAAFQRLATVEVAVRNLGRHAFTLRFPLRVVPER